MIQNFSSLWSRRTTTTTTTTKLVMNTTLFNTRRNLSSDISSYIPVGKRIQNDVTEEKSKEWQAMANLAIMQGLPNKEAEQLKIAKGLALLAKNTSFFLRFTSAKGQRNVVTFQAPVNKKENIVSFLQHNVDMVPASSSSSTSDSTTVTFDLPKNIALALMEKQEEFEIKIVPYVPPPPTNRNRSLSNNNNNDRYGSGPRFGRGQYDRRSSGSYENRRPPSRYSSSSDGNYGDRRGGGGNNNRTSGSWNNDNYRNNRSNNAMDG
jgi:post-segregation antitoxin (ccd killing protein)